MRKRRVLRSALIALGAGIGAAVVLFAVAWALTPIPEAAQKQAVAQGSVIYYRDGKTVLAKQGVNRKTVKLERVPKHVRDAVIAAENRSFYQDTGVSLRGTARAIWSTVTGKQVQGGSTITQQMVRNYYSGLDQERSIGRKFKEIMVALKVDQSKSKDWVLQQYLNTIYFGRGAWGVQAAAQAYFGKDVDKLSIAQGAYLAAVIQQPTRFAAPKGEALTEVTGRWRWVLGAMAQMRAITPEQAAAQRFPKLAATRSTLTPKGQDNYMLVQVRAELARRGYDDEDINQAGLKVTTTFDKGLMAAAEKAVTSTLPDSLPKKIRTGLAAVDPATGEVLAFYGGRYKTSQQYDNAFSAKVQAGSTFKPYALAAALENGYGLETRVNGNSPMTVASRPVENSGGTSYGMVNLVTATRNSINTAFVDLGEKVGLDKIAEVAKASGLPAAQIDPHRSAATFPIGVASLSAVQQASGFGTFAANGMHQEAHVIRSVTDADGKTTEVVPTARRAFSEQAAADATYAMTQVVEGGTGSAARLWDRPVAGKTGTADKSIAAWFAGFTPQLSTTVNMFRDDNKPLVVPGYGELYGGALPARVWRAFMSEAMEGQPVKEFPEPSNRGYVEDYDDEDEPYWDEGESDDDYPRRPEPTDPLPTEPGTPEPTVDPTEQPTEPPTSEEPPGPEETRRPEPPSPDEIPTDGPAPPDRGDRGDRF
ncbi:transglycosylase domain-containing protein [Spongiactinospora sp. 9N601]|uniref:transglycosylase domain-containing protein n=1 Tax=Spongiactinospora sp. 9N601 TaxID=3375149 RepID=UPI0037A27D53